MKLGRVVEDHTQAFIIRGRGGGRDAEIHMKLGQKSSPKKSNTETDSGVRSDGDMVTGRRGGGLNVLPAFQAMQALPKQASQ